MAKIELFAPDSHAKSPATRDETPENGWSFKRVVDAINAMMTEIYAAIGTIGSTAPGPLDEYDVAGVPDATGNARKMIYVSDGADGDPIVAFSDGTIWRRVDTNDEIAGAE